jgi:hypothetical protein
MNAATGGRGTYALVSPWVPALAAVVLSFPAHAAECEFLAAAPVRALHLAPGESTRIQVGSLLETDLPRAVREEYAWSVSPSRLGTVSPRAGSIEWVPVDDGARRNGHPRYLTGLVLDFTAGSEPGMELLSIRIGLPEPDELPLRCHGTEVLVPVTVGSEWGMHTEISSSGRMSIQGSIVGEFSLQPDGTVAGTATTRVTVLGTCVRGVSEGPMRIEGQQVGDMLEVVVFGDFRDDSEPDVQMVESMECMIITLRELPRLLTTLGEWAAEGIGNARCPLRIPMDATHTTFDCGLLEYDVVRLR